MIDNAINYLQAPFANSSPALGLAQSTDDDRHVREKVLPLERFQFKLRCVHLGDWGPERLSALGGW